jgi:hypothetical protein
MIFEKFRKTITSIGVYMGGICLFKDWMLNKF